MQEDLPDAEELIKMGVDAKGQQKIDQVFAMITLKNIKDIIAFKEKKFKKSLMVIRLRQKKKLSDLLN